MGCAASNDIDGVSQPEGVEMWEDDEEFEEKKGARRGRGRGSHGGKEKESKSDFHFDACADDPRHGFSGQITEPDNHPEVNMDQPTTTYALEYVYGYRAQDTRQNVYFNCDGQAVYFTAALGVILDPASNTQKFFGGGEVDCTAKNVANDLEAHTDDIMAIALTCDRTTAVTGQVGAAPAIFTWDACTGEKKCRFKCTKGARGITAVSFCSGGRFIAAVDLSNDHCVYAFDTENGNLVFKEKGDTNKIKDVAFSGKPHSLKFATGGKRHIYFWDVQEKSKKKGLFNGNPMTSFSALCWDAEDFCYGGGANGRVYKFDANEWGRSIKCVGSCAAHAKGNYVSAMAYCEGKVWSGARDRKMVCINPADMSVESSVDCESLLRSIDMMGGKKLCGMLNGTIKCDEEVLMRSHSEGEVWGLTYKEGCGPITTGDDNKVICWDKEKRSAVQYVECFTDRTSEARRGGASTLANTPDSQQIRAVAVSGDWIAFGTNEGGLTIRKADAPDTPCGADGNDMYMKHSTEWIECMAFSPDGSKLAVGSHDDKIRIYDVAADFTLLGTCTGHSSFIVALDWSCDGTYIRTNSGDYEQLFWKTEDCSQDPDGMSNTKGTEWASTSVKISWETRGVYPREVDGTHINGVARSPDGSLIATGDDYGLVSIFNNPCRPGCMPRCYRGHSEHVVRVCFDEDGSKMFSIGGYDQTLMQFSKC